MSISEWVKEFKEQQVKEQKEKNKEKERLYLKNILEQLNSLPPPPVPRIISSYNILWTIEKKVEWIKKNKRKSK